jgi:hypothetical protein
VVLFCLSDIQFFFRRLTGTGTGPVVYRYAVAITVSRGHYLLIINYK